MKTITADQLQEDPDSVLDDVEAGEVYRVTRRGREAARIVPCDALGSLLPRKRSGGSNLAELAPHRLHTAVSIEALLADERAR